MTSAADLLVCSPADESELYKKLCQIETLRLGWLKVQTGPKKSSGTDGVTINLFKKDLDQQLKKLSTELTNKKYRRKTLRRIYMDKLDGGKRPLGMGCVRDKVVQTA
jgi:RNA-directed DNA polymerase